MSRTIIKPLGTGFLASFVLLAIYGSAVSLISGWPFMLAQLSQYWYFLVGLAVGFGVQIAMFSYLKNAMRQHAGRGAVTVTGATSTVAMVSCCAHYLAAMLPLIGLSGAVSIVGAIGTYQIELFWVGLAANAAGIAYMVYKLRAFFFEGKAMAIRP